MRFLNELRYFWAEIREGYPRQREWERFEVRFRQLYSLELAEATNQECLSAAIKISGSVTWAPKVYWLLLARVGRAKDRPGRPAMTLQDVIRMYS